MTFCQPYFPLLLIAVPDGTFFMFQLCSLVTSTRRVGLNVVIRRYRNPKGHFLASSCTGTVLQPPCARSPLGFSLFVRLPGAKPSHRASAHPKPLRPDSYRLCFRGLDPLAPCSSIRPGRLHLGGRFFSPPSVAVPELTCNTTSIAIQCFVWEVLFPHLT